MRVFSTKHTRGGKENSTHSKNFTHGLGRGISGNRRRPGCLREALKQLRRLQEVLGHLAEHGTRRGRELGGSNLHQTSEKERLGLVQGGGEKETHIPVGDNEEYTPEEEDVRGRISLVGSLPVRLRRERRGETWTCPKEGCRRLPRKNSIGVGDCGPAVTRSGSYLGKNERDSNTIHRI